MSAFEEYGPQKRRRRKNLAVAAGLLCLGLAGAVALKLRNSPHPPPPQPLVQQILRAREAARYDEALRLTAEGLRSQPEDKVIQQLSVEFQRDLKPDLRLRYLIRQTLPPRSPQPGSRLELSPDDEYYFTLDLPSKCHVYLFTVNSSGEWTALFPNRSFALNGNPLPQTLYRIPDVTHPRLRVKPHPGMEKLFAVAAYWRIDALERLAQRLNAKSGTEGGSEASQELLARLRSEESAADTIPGLAFGTIEFHNAGQNSERKAEDR